MRKFKIFLMSIVCSIVAALFVTEAFASVLVNLNIGGDIVYISDEIGVNVFGTYKKTGRDAINHTYMTISGQGTTDENGVYCLEGSEDSYISHTATIEPINVYSESDEIIFYIFVKNTGDRFIIPTIATTSKSEDINFSIEKYYFDISDSQTDYVQVKRTGATAPTLISQVESEISGINYQTFSDNQSLEKQDVFMAKIVITVDNVINTAQYSNFGLTLSFIADIQYTNANILSVRQENNILSPAWEKVGLNRNYSASSIKGETNDLGKLASAYNGRNTNATLTTINSNLTYDCDDYDDLVIYKDIDVVNIDIATGEIIGKLSDLNYDFEWFGGDVTLNAGTTLASGRTLETQETFTVDVYTYYPTFYIRRWTLSGTTQGGSATTYTYISVSDNPFAGCVEVSECYIGITEGTIFNPDGTVAHNSNGIFLRSYIFPWSVTSNTGASHMINNYGFSTYSEATNTTTQSQYLTWQNNLTIDWQTFASTHPTLKTASKATGENYRAFSYEILYLVKYANNNSQETVGEGNVRTRALYNGSFSNSSNVYNKGTVKNISVSSGSDNSRVEAAKGGGVIGLKGTANATTGTSSYNKFGMAYGYNNSGTELYAVDFLTYNNGEKRILRDGYIGSNGYTSVCCLGRFNPWGNTGTWVCGAVTIFRDSQAWGFIQFDEYNGSNYYLVDTQTTESHLINNLGYAKLSYNLPKTKNTYRYCGVSSGTTNNSTINGLLTLIALPTSAASVATPVATTGTTDGYWAPTSSYTTGVLWGGAAHNTTDAGLFYHPCDPMLSAARGDYGFRAMLL